MCSVENFYCLSSYSTILTELRALFTAGKALIYAAVYGWRKNFAAGKIYNILPYYNIFFLYTSCRLLVPSFSLSKDKYPRTNIVVHYKYYYYYYYYYYYPAAIGKKLQTMTENLKH